MERNVKAQGFENFREHRQGGAVTDGPQGVPRVVRTTPRSSLTGPRSSYARSPRILLASWMSLGMMVTLLAWMAHRFVSSNRPTR